MQQLRTSAAFNFNSAKLFYHFDKSPVLKKSIPGHRKNVTEETKALTKQLLDLTSGIASGKSSNNSSINDNALIKYQSM